MKCKYIPGDLVYLKDSKGCWNIRTLHTLDLTTLINYDDINPISLTPAILEKNGWEKFRSKRLTWWRVRFGSTYFYIRQNRQFPTIWFVCRGKSRHVLKRVKYVHQLQHILFVFDINSEMEV